MQAGNNFRHEKINASYFHFLHTICHRLRGMASPSLLNDANALLYSAKSFTAAMLAYYIALSIGPSGLPGNYHRIYCFPNLRRSIAKQKFVSSGGNGNWRWHDGINCTHVREFPVFCSVILAGWITFCLYLSLLERTPRAYGFVLAGYTASLIGFPAVSDPGAIFDIAITRVQEIMIGIFCATLIHRYVLPARISGQFNSKLSQTRSRRDSVSQRL